MTVFDKQQTWLSVGGKVHETRPEGLVIAFNSSLDEKGDSD